MICIDHPKPSCMYSAQPNSGPKQRMSALVAVVTAVSKKKRATKAERETTASIVNAELKKLAAESLRYWAQGEE